MRRLAQLSPLALLAVQALALSARFDVMEIARRHAWWEPLRDLGSWLPLGLLLAVGLLMTLGEQLLHLVRVRPLRGQMAWLAGASLLFVLVFQLTAVLERTDERAGVWIDIGWALLVGIWLLVATHSVLPLRAAWKVTRQLPRSTIAGLAVGAAAYVAGRIVLASWDSLAPVTLIGVGIVLLVLGRKPWLEGDLIVGLDDFSIHLAPGCSGVEGMGLLSAFLLGFMAIFHRRIRLRRAFFLVPLALLSSLVFNAIRIALLLIIGAAGHEDVALAGFHTKAGWVFFSFVALAFVALMRTRYFTRSDAASEGGVLPLEEALTGSQFSSPTPYVLPLLILTLVGLVTESFAVTVDHLYGLRHVAAFVCILVCARELASRSLSWSGALSGVPIGLLGFLVWWLLIPVDPEQLERVRGAYEQFTPPRRYFELSVRFLGSSLLVPLVEEFAFRGYLMRRIQAEDFEEVSYRSTGWIAIALSSLVFGFLHGGVWIPAAICGGLFAFASRFQNSLSAAVWAHATTNAAVFIAAVGFGRYDFL